LTYSTCPNCGIRIGSRHGIGPTQCPRCLARTGLSVDLVDAVRREHEAPSTASDNSGGIAMARETAPTTESWIEHGALSIRTERDPAQVCVVEFYGELDLAGIEVAADELRRCEQTDAEEIIVDLSGLDFIDSSGLRILLETYQSERQNGNRLLFLRGSEPVERVMHLTRLDEVLPFAD
jgi:anti-sigma B factor antagonist